MDGFTFAAQAGVGTAVRVTDDWQLPFDVKRYFWDGAIDTIPVIGTDPSVAGAPPRSSCPSSSTGRTLGSGPRQRVPLDERTWTLRAGYNYGENPVPDETLTPLFPATTEHHLSVGASLPARQRHLRVRPRARLQRLEHQQQSRPDGQPLRPRRARRPQPVDDRLRGLVGEVTVESLTEDAMNRSRILIAVGMTARRRSLHRHARLRHREGRQAGRSLVHGLPRQAGQQAPHRPGQVLRNDAHPRRFRDLKATFGACTNCHVTKPGSKKLTAKGKEFQDIVKDMEGLGTWMQEHHPKPRAGGRCRCAGRAEGVSSQAQ